MKYFSRLKGVRKTNEIVYIGKNLITFSMHRHSHENWELVYCTKGGGEFLFENSSIKYSEGDIVVIPPDTLHANNSVEGFTNIHINIENAMLSFKEPVIISDDGEKHILNSFNDAFYFYNSAIDNKALILAAFGNLIVNYVIAFHNTKPLREVTDMIKNDIMKNFTDCGYELDEFLKTIPFSYDYLRKIFKNDTGLTPHNFLTSLRMEMAKQLLCTADGSDQNISQIAYICGFSEPLYFSRVFKKYYGCSPKNYADKHKKE